MARPRQVTDEQILQTMRDSVLQHGPAVSLDVVAEQLNVTAPALIKRFGTRRALLIAALKPPEASAVFDDLARGPDGRPLPEQLEGLIGAFTEFFGHAMPCIIALRESGIPHSELYRANEAPLPLRLIRALTKWLGQAQTQGLIDCDAHDTAATAVVGALTTRAFTAHLTQTPWSGRAQREYGKQLAQLFTRALSPTPRKPHS